MSVVSRRLRVSAPDEQASRDGLHRRFVGFSRGSGLATGGFFPIGATIAIPMKISRRVLLALFGASSVYLLLLAYHTRCSPTN